MKRLSGFLFLLLVFACSEADDELLPIGSIVKIEVGELSESGLSQPVLYCATEKEYSCINYSLMTDEDLKEVPFSISFVGVQPPEKNCATAVGPANTTIHLGSLQNGVYDLLIHTPSFTNKGTIAVTDQEIRLDFPQQKGISIVKATVQR